MPSVDLWIVQASISKTFISNKRISNYKKQLLANQLEKMQATLTHEFSIQKALGNLDN